MKKISKKEIEATVSKSLTAVVSDYKISKPSKKTNKLIRKVSKRISAELKQDLQKQLKKMERASETAVNGNFSSKAVSA